MRLYRWGFNMYAAKLTIDGLEDLVKALSYFPREMKNAMRAAARKTGGAVKKTAKQKAPKRNSTLRIGKQIHKVYGGSGTLKKAIVFVVRTNPRTGKVYVLVGADRAVTGKVTVKLWKINETHTVKPSKYSHLVENGFTAKVFNGKTVRVSAKPFLRPALDAYSNQIESVTRAEIEKALNKVLGEK
jgi:HK97 gp10 family phage protein